MTTILAYLARLALVAVFTFGFVVLFDFGPSNYLSNAQTEWKTLVSFVQSRVNSSQAAADAAPTPSQSSP